MEFRDILIVVGYLVLMITLGFALSWKSRRPIEFMLAKRALPGWALGFSLFASSMSNISFMGDVGKAYTGNWVVLGKYLMLPVAAVIAVKYFMRFHRRNGYASAYTHLEKRFGQWAGTYTSGLYILISMFRMSAIMYLMSAALSPILGLHANVAILAIGSIVIIYSCIGGLEAVVWTDLIQGIVFFVGSLFVAGYILMSMPEGPAQVFEIASLENKFSLGDMGLSFGNSSFWVMALVGLTMFIPGLGMDQERVQRYVAADSEEGVKSSYIWSVALTVCLHILLLFVGTCLYAFYLAHPSEAVASGVAEMKGDLILSSYIATQLPVGIKGLLIAAILASGMSSIDSAINGVSTVFVSNIYQRYISRHPGERKTMRALHRSSIFSGSAAILGAIGMTYVSSIWDLWNVVYTILAGGMFGLFLLGVASKQANNTGAKWGVGISALISAWMVLSPKADFLPTYLKNPMSGFMTGIVGTLSIVVFGLIFSRIALGSNSGKEEELALEHS